MSIPLRVLIVEDSEDDTLLLLRELRRGGYEPSFERVENAEDMKAALDKRTWDVILADHGMAQFNSLAALRLVKKNRLDVPFIIVSGMIGEDMAVAAMRAGAHDYIMKNNLVRLVPAVERELGEAEVRRERKRAEEEADQLREYLQLQVDRMPIALIVWDTQFRVESWNPAAEKIFGFTAPEALGRHPYDLIVPEGAQQHVDSIWRRLLEGDTTAHSINDNITKDGRTIICQWSNTPLKRANGTVIGVLSMAQDITEHKRAQEELIKSCEKLQRVLEGTVQALAATVEIRDPYTAGHQRRATQLACAIAREMDLSEENIGGLHISGQLHDIGKICVPSEILSKPGRISESEFAIIATHSQVGYDILKPIEFDQPIAQIVLQHHERMDGSGYPSGLLGEEIMLEARILGVADVIEAMASHRPYRPALGIDKALEEIEGKRGVLYDPNVVDACLKVFRERWFEFD